VNTCIKEVVNLCTPLLSLSEVSVGVKIDSKLPLYTGDQEQIRQVFTNLTMNSIQAMQDGGVLKIRTSFNKEDEGNAIFIDFTDNGKGVPYDQREQIFEPFFTTKPKGIGTGLGLSLSKKIIEAHGGKLELLNLQYDGGHFRITLPLVSQEESVEA
jgi:two-component system NtrC family sensor kinase